MITKNIKRNTIGCFLAFGVAVTGNNNMPPPTFTGRVNSNTTVNLSMNPNRKSALLKL